MEELRKSTAIAVSGMKAQARRLRVISENLANANSLPSNPGEAPYRRKTITFRSELDQTLGANLVTVQRTGVDRSEFQKRYDPKHPAADSAGYVLAPNVDPLIELMDMREAQRTYEANLNVVSTSKAMVSRTIEMLR